MGEVKGSQASGCRLLCLLAACVRVRRAPVFSAVARVLRCAATMACVMLSQLDGVQDGIFEEFGDGEVAQLCLAAGERPPSRRS